ncbi:hypothetical protein J2X11_001466 [Aeromicrobium panaciterrae]|uniref:Histidine phosphatase superfamily (Branch 2) n=1 Tax=Aeromicrobium panaciterrae TaxID=363861 RepID=A0ABU1UN85_9ACTN|nr:hypothetical protein [Aeromicrobium panaciterrae]MDR7086627.1 hypothetical protein [Aeromicrobium panaciterrae]
MVNFFAALVTLLSTLVSSLSAAPDDGRYNKEVPYGNALSSPIKAAPNGYEPIFIENLGRHGSRTLTSSAGEARARKIWNAAKKQNALTQVGETFDEDLTAFQKAEQKIGYGNMSQLGKAEWAGIGRRTADNYGDYLKKATADGDSVAYKVTTFQRTEESADAMIGSLKKVVPDLKLSERFVDLRLLIIRGSTIEANHAVNQILASNAVVDAAKGLLRELYTPTYVDSIEDPVDAALDIYKVYATAPGMQGDTNVTFEKYVALKYAKVLAYATDAQLFYGFGPGIAGQDFSYRQAKPILADFFTELDKRIKGGSTAAVFRPAHGETIMPFAALLRLPGSEKQAAKGDVYTYENNPWRGSVAGRLAGNVEWVAYRNAAKDVLVTMRYNEQQVKFRKGCKAVEPYFYQVAELKRCLR